MKNRRLWSWLVAFVVLGAAFLLLNFRLAVSHTRSARNIGSTGMGSQMPHSMQRRDKITIAVVGDGPQARALRSALAGELDHAGLGNVEEALALAPEYQNPVLVVKTGGQSLLWTPFFATSTFGIQAGFASNGDAGLLGQTPISVDNKNGPVFILSGEYKFTDRSWGLISRLGYHQLLADYAAQEIVASLKDAYAVP